MTPKLKSYFSLLIIAVILISGIIFLPGRFKQINQARRLLKENRQLLATLTNKISQLESMSAQDLQVDNTLALKALPVSKEVPQLIYLIKSLSQEAGLILDSINSNPGELDSGSVDYEFNLIGTLDQIQSFILTTNKTLPIIKLESVSFNNNEGTYEAVCELTSPLLPLPLSLGTIETPVVPISTEEKTLLNQLRQYHSPSVDSESLPSVPSGKSNPFIL